jgi:hypothetical protein
MRKSMHPSPFNDTVIAPCGMNCGVCRAYLRERNPCHGCNDAEQNQPATRVNCRLRICGKRTGRFCSSCAEFPCDRLKRLDTRYRERYGMSQIENLLCIKERGMEKFLEEEDRKWITDKGVLCVHDNKYYRISGDGAH